MSDRAPDEFDDLKSWLYIQQDIERDLRACLAKARPGEILFLCGSSGDGKSEILTRVFHEYQGTVTFHLDATHSFSPHQTAIEALDLVFRTAQVNNQILVVGINVGMIGNYALEGADDLMRVRDAMRAFLDGGRPAGTCHFFSFESYPKFSMEGDGIAAPFAKKIMRRLTEANPNNPFYAVFKRDDVKQLESRLFANYRLLMLDGVQDAIIANIAKARLAKDQFVTARGLLDLLHHLLTGPDYLFNNLFTGGDNELVARLITFDPALLRTSKLDQLTLEYELQLPELQRDCFLAELKRWNISFPDDQQSAASLVRLLYILQRESVANNYHRLYSAEFTDHLVHDYAVAWKLHSQFDGGVDARAIIRKFYISVIIAGIFRYANRNAPELGKTEILLGDFNGIKVAGFADLKPDYAALQQLAQTASIGSFNVALKVGDTAIKVMPFNINLFGLLLRLNQGYRPNKYDKNAVVLLEDLVEQIKRLVKTGERLKLIRQGNQISLRYEDGMIDTIGEH